MSNECTKDVQKTSRTSSERLIYFKFMLCIQGDIMQKQPREEFYKRSVLKIFAIFTGKHLSWSLFIIKLQALRPEGLNFDKFLKTLFFSEHLWRMLLNMASKVIDYY